MVFPQRSGRIL
nr:unnamed protein product [Callosobruchus analis]CAI5843631.1 unnamed protein product [Callosobruchus analis]